MSLTKAATLALLGFYLSFNAIICQVPAVRQRPEWKRFTIFVWQYKTDVTRDQALYEQAGLRAFHIDRGKGRENLVKFSLENSCPYYVDHVAGKGILYLNNALRAEVMGKSSLLIRPHSLADPEVIEELKRQIRQNVMATKNGLVYAYAFDDEISLGSFNSPAEVDVHPLSIAWYRRWLAERYGTIQKLNASWGATYRSFNDVKPVSFEDVRRSASAPPISNWNLSRWMEWRHFMDFQFSQVLADLTRYTNQLDPGIPAGFVGGQIPSAYGGYDYALLSRSVQWMEGSGDLIRSFWNNPRRPHAKTLHLTGSTARDTWTLWHRLANGDQAAIAWPEGWFETDPKTGKRTLARKVQALASVFREIQGSASEFIVSPDTHLDTDPIGIYYSHPSIRASWVMDSITHGRTWPKRLSSLDDDNLSSARLRSSWCRLLEDLGYQYNFISYLDVQEKRIDLSKRYKVIILPQTICLSEIEADALKAFVRSGGTILADNLTGILTETGRGRKVGALDDIFGVARDEAKGYLDGEGLTEIDAEYAGKPLPDRLRAYKDSLRKGYLVVFERGTKIRPKSNRSIYLNLTPLAYEHPPYRKGRIGQEWRYLIGQKLRAAGLYPRVTVDQLYIESLFWRNENQYTLAVVNNQEDVITPEVRQIRIRIALPANNIRNLRSGKSFKALEFTDSFNPAEANFYSFNLPH
jgi:hypothetical protein